MKLSLFKIEFYTIVRNHNYLMFLPTCWLILKKSGIEITITWLIFRFIFICDYNYFNGKKYLDCAIIPNISLYHLNNSFKEKWDFQFFWFNIKKRKFFGNRNNYEESLKKYEL